MTRRATVLSIQNSEITNDDFAMDERGVEPSFARMDASNRPDVILLDGGRGQLNAVHESLKNFDLDGIAIIAITRGPERMPEKSFTI